MSNLRKRLQRLANATEPTEAESSAEPGPATRRVIDREPELPIALEAKDEAQEARRRRIDELRERVRALAEKPSKRSERATREAKEAALSELPFIRHERVDGAVDVRTRVYDVTARHGHVPLKAALDAVGASVATLAIDRGLSDFDPTRALFLDTETTGLSGGTGMMAFLVGAGRFENGQFVVEQWFLREPSEEPALLLALRERIESATSIVSFNGKAFDLPLLRARYVMNRLGAPPSPPHFDLVHVARRIYGDRMRECRLVHLERDVLGFVREGDVHGSEIPARYSEFLRRGNAAGLVPVIEHNLWDVIAMAALVGELVARASGGDALGRFEASDMAGLAKTALRAGDHSLAIAMAGDALAHGRSVGERAVVSRAGAVAARAHRKRGEHALSREALLKVIESAPDDAHAHLELSKIYEHKYRDSFRALEHARRAIGAEKDESLAKRLARLESRLRTSTLKLPGID
ncbi:MAG: ribonuclease H-like domain-containing protein [Myxococcales bacterium]|nr:ribonuclease H-like domain-containing protein [Myxococcales bacterium]